MPKEERETTDVLVVGAGIAGTTAALAAAQAGARVTVATHGPLFSGSSFYPGTWGLGLVGPESPEDEADLARTIETVGCGMADPRLVEAFVHGIAPAIARLEETGAELKRPERADEREFVPCFDRKRRLWRGILREPYERAVGRALHDAGVRVRENVELLDLAAAAHPAGRRKAAPHARVDGALLFDHGSGTPLRLQCKAVVLACGGYGGLFERRLTGADVTGAVHAIALRHGARLVNMEFLQMMPGLVDPCRGVVFNEKAFRFMEFDGSPAARSLTDRADARSLLDERSGYGPFTSRLAARAVDAAIDAAGPNGLALRCRPAVFADGADEGRSAVPEFVRSYYDWLKESFGVRPEDWVRIAPYAHAANGGILIDEDGWTGVPGLFACGEATGGMHGADRIGGLSSANGLVFGAIAGTSAARWAQEDAPCARPQDAHAGSRGRRGQAPSMPEALRSALSDGAFVGENAETCAFRKVEGPDGLALRVSFGARERTRRMGLRTPGGTADEASAAIAGLRASMQHTMSAGCMIVRTEAGLAQAEAALREIERTLDDVCPNGAALCDAGPDDAEPCGADAACASVAADAARLRNQLVTARCVVAAMRARRESRGAHYRADFPAQDPAFGRPIVIGREAADGGSAAAQPNSHASHDAASRCAWS